MGKVISSNNGNAMRGGLVWKFCWAFAIAASASYWLFSALTVETERHMSFIAKQHQLTLRAYSQQAEQIYHSQGEPALAQWLQQIQRREDTWAGIIRSDLFPIAGSQFPPQFLAGFSLGRAVDWKIHLYFPENPIIELPFLDDQTHLLIQLPQRMRPGTYLPHAQALFKLLFPLVFIALISVLVYRHVKQPLRQLEKITRRFTAGEFDVRAKDALGERNDELSALATTFDQMAERTGNMILTQRQLLADLSHELRTPLTRIDLTIASIEHGVAKDEAVQRLYHETGKMRELVEDALTLAWLSNEEPQLGSETVDLVALLNAITEDAQFEFQDRTLVSHLPERATLSQSNHQALGQALENVIRNALRYTPAGGEVTIHLTENAPGYYRIRVSDQGPGVPEPHLSDIFKPFFRVDKTRQNREQDGFGLGLALVERNIKAVGGQIFARNRRLGDQIIGLEMVIDL